MHSTHLSHDLARSNASHRARVQDKLLRLHARGSNEVYLRDLSRAAWLEALKKVDPTVLKLAVLYMGCYNCADNLHSLRFSSELNIRLCRLKGDERQELDARDLQDFIDAA